MKRKNGLRGIDRRATGKPKGIRPSKVFIYALALAALGGGGYLLYDHFRRKKLAESSSESIDTAATGNNTNTNYVYTGSTTASTSKKKSTARTAPSDDFPLKKGSKGLRVEQLQKALMKKNADIQADGKFGAATQAALKALGYSDVVDESTFAKLTGVDAAALRVVFNPKELAQKLLSAANRRNDDDAVYILGQIKSVADYTAVNDYYKKQGLISKTIVTDLLDYSFKQDAAALERIKAEFIRIGLKVNEAGIWSLQGIQLYKDLITIRPTVVIDGWGNRIPVKKSTILGDEVKIENGMTWFRSVDRTILKVPTQDVRYA